MKEISLGSKIFDIINTVFLITLAVGCALPFINVIALSFSDSSAAAAGQVGLLPVGFNLSSYKYALGKKEFIDAFVISVIRVVIGLALSLFITIMAAYPLSRNTKEFKAKNIYIWYFFITMLFSGGLIPFYIVINKLGLTDNLLGIILPFTVSTYSLILMVGFFRSLPNEINEAAVVDGAGHMTILWKIMLPVSLPGVATIALITGVFFWNEWFFGQILTNTTSKYPLQSYLQTIVISKVSTFTAANPEELKELSKVSDRTLKSAQIIIAMVPILAFYPWLQRYFIKGLVLGSVKG